jgi:hypothetical protein
VPTKPKFISIVTFLLCCIVISFPLQIIMAYDYQWTQVSAIFSKLTPLNYLLMTLFLVMAYQTYYTKKSIYYFLPIVTFFVFLNNFIVAEYGNLYGHAQTLLASVAFLLLAISYYQKNIYQVYQDVKFRWWLTSPRFKKQYHVTMSFQNEKYETKTFDISKTGLFVESDELLQLFQIPNQALVNITIHLPDQKVTFEAKVVRKALWQGQYPPGLGLQLLKQQENAQEILMQACA